MLLVVGFCNCHAGHTGDDCRVDMESPPEIVTEPEYNVLLVRTSLEHSALKNSNESAMYSTVPEI
jgi:hypothetical protein